MKTEDKPLEWKELWNAMDRDPGLWIPTTENMYWDMLEAVPPEAMAQGAFLVGEASHHNNAGEAVYACFKEVGDAYEARYMTVREFQPLRRARATPSRLNGGY